LRLQWSPELVFRQQALHENKGSDLTTKMRELTQSVSQDLASPPSSPEKQTDVPWYKRETQKLNAVSALVSDDTVRAIGKLQGINTQMGRIQKEILRLLPEDKEEIASLETKLAALEIEAQQETQRVKEGKKALETSKKLAVEVEFCIQGRSQIIQQREEIVQTSATALTNEVNKHEREKTGLQREAGVKQMRWCVTKWGSSSMTAALTTWKIQFANQQGIDKTQEAEQHIQSAISSEVVALTHKLSEAEGRITEVEDRATRSL